MTPIISAIGLALFAFVLALVLAMGVTRDASTPRRWYNWLTDLRVLLPIGIVGLSLQLIGEPVIRPHVVQYLVLIGIPAVLGSLGGRTLRRAGDTAE